MTRRKLVLYSAGVGAVVVLIAVVLSWRQIATRYYMWKLHSENEALGQIGCEPEGSVEFETVRNFLESGKGRLAFFQHVHATFERSAKLGYVQTLGLDATEVEASSVLDRSENERIEAKLISSQGHFSLKLEPGGREILMRGDESLLRLVSLHGPAIEGNFVSDRFPGLQIGTPRPCSENLSSCFGGPRGGRSRSHGG